jgi:hypothetical protein
MTGERLSKEDGGHRTLTKLLEFRPVQFCIFMKALVGVEEMQRIVIEAVFTAKQV